MLTCSWGVLACVGTRTTVMIVHVITSIALIPPRLIWLHLLLWILRMVIRWHPWLVLHTSLSAMHHHVRIIVLHLRRPHVLVLIRVCVHVLTPDFLHVLLCAANEVPKIEDILR